MAQRLYVKRKVAIDDATWTPVSSPIMTRSAVVKNAGDSTVMIRTDADDDTTEDTLTPWAQEVVNLNTSRLLPDVPFLFARVASGLGGPLIVSATAV